MLVQESPVVRSYYNGEDVHWTGQLKWKKTITGHKSANVSINPV